MVAVTDASGTLISQQRYLPFGQVRTDTNPPFITQTDLGYTGQRNLDAQGNVSLGLMDYRARMYDAYITQAFIQPDDIIPDYKNPQSLNRYAYVLGNPIRYNDPDGHCVEDFCIVEVAVATSPEWFPVVASLVTAATLAIANQMTHRSVSTFNMNPPNVVNPKYPTPPNLDPLKKIAFWVTVGLTLAGQFLTRQPDEDVIYPIPSITPTPTATHPIIPLAPTPSATYTPTSTPTSTPKPTLPSTPTSSSNSSISTPASTTVTPEIWHGHILDQE